MNVTTKKPELKLDSFKRTKIVATLGPATDTYELVVKMIQSGANAIRLNFSHGTHEERTRQIKWIRKASRELGKPVAIIQDLQGPKIRLGDFDGMINIKKGQELSFGYLADHVASGIIPVQYDLSHKVKRGERLNLWDGRIRTVVTSVRDGIVRARAENEGIIVKRKGINLPDTDFHGDTITDKDRKDLAFGSTQDIDYVAQSFVQSAEDIKAMRRIMKNLGMTARLITKFETKAAVDNIEEIVQATDVIMVARGDLAAEVSPESVPVLQRQLIGLCLKHCKLSIVATQMLLSMREAPDPTRAEVSDVATAVILGADAVMLSEETAEGQYPIESIKMMKRIIVYTQSHTPLRVQFDYEREVTPTGAIADAVVNLANTLKATAIVAETKSGATALQIAARRPHVPMIVVTSSDRVAQQMVLSYSGMSFVRPDSRTAAIRLTDWLRHQKLFKSGDVIVMASGRYPGVIGSTDTIKVRVLE